MRSSLLDALAEICRESAVEILYVFGRRTSAVMQWVEADGPALPASLGEVGIGVKLQSWTIASEERKAGLGSALAEWLQGGRVTLIDLDEANPFQAVNIVCGECLYTHNPIRANEYELYVFRRAGDLAPWERERLTLVLGRRRRWS
jgi:uncharacterized protein